MLWAGRTAPLMKAFRIFEAEVVRSRHTFPAFPAFPALLSPKLFPAFACELKMPLGGGG